MIKNKISHEYEMRSYDWVQMIKYWLTYEDNKTKVHQTSANPNVGLLDRKTESVWRVLLFLSFPVFCLFSWQVRASIQTNMLFLGLNEKMSSEQKWSNGSEGIKRVTNEAVSWQWMHRHILCFLDWNQIFLLDFIFMICSSSWRETRY